MDKKISDLEHEVILTRVDMLEVKIHEGFGAIAKSIQANFDIYRAENKAENKASAIQRDAILSEQKRTNGRVTKLEEVTSVIKFMKENRTVTGLIFYAVYNILNVSSIENAINIYKWIKLMV